MHTTTRFRRAELADVEELVSLVESAYRGESSRAGWTTEADLLGGRRTDADAVREIITGSGSRMVVAERGGRIAGCCQLARGDDHAYFGMFAVSPDGQGRGLGSEILAEAERIAGEEWRSPQLQMTVIRQREDLIAWYVRRGYRRTGTFSPFPYGDARFGLPRRDDLAFELLVKTLR